MHKLLAQGPRRDTGTVAKHHARGQARQLWQVAQIQSPPAMQVMSLLQIITLYLVAIRAPLTCARLNSHGQSLKTSRMVLQPRVLQEGLRLHGVVLAMN
jgi:hypothetical protein